MGIDYAAGKSTGGGLVMKIEQEGFYWGVLITEPQWLRILMVVKGDQEDGRLVAWDRRYGQTCLPLEAFEFFPDPIKVPAKVRAWWKQRAMKGIK